MDIFRQKIENRHLDLFLSGYIRLFIQNEIKYTIIPKDINRICMAFYGSMDNVGSIKDTFHDYDGDERNVNQCYQFIVDKFSNNMHASRYKRQIHVYSGRAINRNNIKYLMNIVQTCVELVYYPIGF